MLSGSCVDSAGSGQLYRENRRKHPKYHDFAQADARRSRTYVNMVKIVFQSGENWCLVTHPEA
jgi:hypothetical protein